MHPKGVVVVEDAVPGGKAVRASSRPAALEQVGNRPIAHHVLDALESAGVEEVIVASSKELADDVRASLAEREQGAGVSLRFVHGRAPVDLAAALKLAAPIVGDAPCIVHQANGLLDEPLARLADCLAGDSPTVVLIMHQTSAPNEHLSPATQQMLHLADLHPERSALGLAGVWLFGPQALAEMAAATWRTASLIHGPATQATHSISSSSTVSCSTGSTRSRTDR
jgi:dTDP-glucose pyrophosphorylase